MEFFDHKKGIVVTDVIGPGPNAEHGLFHFIPDYSFHISESSRIYNSSNRVSFYLGDWQSHLNSSSYVRLIEKHVKKDFKT